MNKGLEALKIIYELEDLQGGRDEFWKAYRIIEKELKAFQIIKEKLVDVNWLKGCDELQDYNWCNNVELTQEEYDLLKEALS